MAGWAELSSKNSCSSKIPIFPHRMGLEEPQISLWCKLKGQRKRLASGEAADIIPPEYIFWEYRLHCSWSKLLSVPEHRASNLSPAFFKNNKKHGLCKNSVLTGDQDSTETEAVNFSKQPKDRNARHVSLEMALETSLKEPGGHPEPKGLASTAYTHNPGPFSKANWWIEERLQSGRWWLLSYYFLNISKESCISLKPYWM